MVNLLHHFDTQIFGLGGGVALNAWKFPYPPILTVVTKQAMPALREGVRIVRAELGDDGGLKGTVALVVSGQL